MKIFNAHRWVMPLFILISFGIISYISLITFRNYPFCMDEYNYLYQAKIFASGHGYVPANFSLHDLFETFMIFHDGKLFSKYPPGFSLILSFGVKFGVEGLINPLLSIASLFLFYLIGARLIGKLYSLVALLLIVSNSYFLGYAASYFSQPASVFFLTLALFFYQRYWVTQRVHLLWIVALIISYATLVRPLDAVCLWIVLLIDLIIQEKKRVRVLLMFFLISTVGGVLLLGYNKLMLGEWVFMSKGAWEMDGSMLHLLGERDATIFHKISSFFGAYCANLKLTCWPLLKEHFILYFVCWIPILMLNFFAEHEQVGLKRFYFIIFFYSLLMVLVYNLEVHNLGWPQYGSRYWYPLIIPLGLLLAGGLKVFYSHCPRYLFVLIIGACLMYQAYQCRGDFQRYAKRFDLINDSQKNIDRQCPSKSIVILNAPHHWNLSASSDFANWFDMKRNPFLKGERIYLVTAENIRIIQRDYPDYSICNYFFPEPYR